MVTIPIHQASFLVPSLSTPVIDLTSSKPISSTIQEPVFTVTPATTITTLPLPPPLQQQSSTDPEFANHVSALKKVSANFEKKHKLQDQTIQVITSRVFTLENHDLYSKIDKQVNEVVKEGVERPEEPKPDWAVPPNDLPELKNNWSNALTNSHQDLKENKLLWKTSDMSSFIKCKPLPLGGPPGQVTIQPQYFFNKDMGYLLSGDKERRNALSMSKLKAAYYPDFGLEELVPSLLIESEREYDISAAYGISHWRFKRKEFDITRHSAPSDRLAVRSHMRILSVISLKTYSRYSYTFLDRNNQKKMTGESEVHKFSDGTLKRIIEKLDHLVKYFGLFKFYSGMENRIWYEDDKEGAKSS
nr:hypothetical protein [Tanacetum cinerariifolium]